LDELSDEALKKEATTEAKSDTFSSIMKSLRHLCRRVPAREDIESFRLKMILRLVLCVKAGAWIRHSFRGWGSQGFLSPDVDFSSLEFVNSA
jgi:hypothetical protein